MFSTFIQTVKASAYDIGQQYVEHTGRAVDYGFLLTVEKTKQAIDYTGVADYASKAIETTNNVIISTGADEYTRKAVEATGKAVQYTAQRAAGADISQKALVVTEKVFDVTEKAVGVSLEYTRKAIDVTVDGTKKVVEVTGKALLEQNVLDNMLGGFKDEIYSITQESNEIMLKSLYPNWNGAGNGFAEVLGSMEDAWRITGTNLTQQQLAAQRTEQAVLSLLTRLNAQHEGWKSLQVEVSALPALINEIASVKAAAEAAIVSAEALAVKLLECEAGAVQAELVSMSTAAAKKAAAREEKHQRAISAALSAFRADKQQQLQAGVWMIGGEPGADEDEKESSEGDDSYLEETGGIVMPGLRHQQ